MKGNRWIIGGAIIAAAGVFNGIHQIKDYNLCGQAEINMYSEVPVLKEYAPLSVKAQLKMRELDSISDKEMELARIDTKGRNLCRENLTDKLQAYWDASKKLEDFELAHQPELREAENRVYDIKVRGRGVIFKILLSAAFGLSGIYTAVKYRND